MQSHAGGQRRTSFPHINDSTGLRFTIDDRHHAVNERQNVLNGQNLVNGHHNPINEHHTSVNDYNNHHSSTPIHCKINSIAQSKIKISNNEQPKITNGLKNNKSEQPAYQSSHKQNNYPIKNYQNNVDQKNGINRLTNEKPTVEEQLQKDTFNIAINLRQLLRPTVIEKRQENTKVEYDTEDINGPYNFRQLLRPTGYLPTESLRKRKGGLVSNGVPLPKDKVPEKHVKRRAPLAPTQNKLANGKK